MPVFAYKAYNGVGDCISGSLTADTPAAGRRSLRDQGLQLIEYQAAGPGAKRALHLRWGRSRRQDRTSEFARQLAMLAATGVSVVEALDVLIRQESGPLVPVLREVREKVAAGSSLSEALAAHPTWFDGVFCSAVKVGQMSGQLDVSLKELSKYVRARQTIKTKLLTALAYPILLAVLGTCVVLFLMSYVVPQLLTVLEASGRSLPAATALLKSISDFIVRHWTALVLGAVLLIGSVLAFYGWKPGRSWCHGVWLRLPLIGALARRTTIAQFAQMMSLLLRSGVPFTQSLRLVRENARNLVLRNELEGIESAIHRGSDIAPTLENSRIFPPLVVHIVNVGQRAGELTEMLAQLKEGYETEVRLAIGKFTAVLEPVLIVIMSAVVGFVVFATLMPILEVTRAIQ
ncbi:MAG: type II secretion system F family protein [Phycisphaerae bacterium]|jgi:type II secretory pathway component PulF